MRSSTPTTTTATASLFLRHRFIIPNLFPPNSFIRSKNNTMPLHVSASGSDTRVDLSWQSLTTVPDDDRDFNGWAVVYSPSPPKKTTGSAAAILIGGTCLAALVSAVAYFSLYRKGFRLQLPNPLFALHEFIKLDEAGTKGSRPVVIGDEEFVPSEALSSVSAEKVEPAKVFVPVDSAQLEAFSVLKKLKIIEDGMRANELCTRREYARWLVRLNTLLERNPRNRIVPPMSLSSFTTSAFDDVGVEDPDFEIIQSLAEAGIVNSKLSGTWCSSGTSACGGSFYFYPDRFICRKDVIDWKAQLEYGILPGLGEQMSTRKVDYMDVTEIVSDASPELLADVLAGERSIIRKVFGQSRRVQPRKPLSRAQAAVAVMSGRMTEAVYNEILRLEAENNLRLATMKEIRSELLERGDIERSWNERIKEEKDLYLSAKRLYSAALDDLEQEKICEEKCHSDHLKEKAALDCQKQLLLSLKEEVDEMSKRLATERATYVAVQCNLQQSLNELQSEQEGLIDAKSILEAEIEALRILQSWVEDEARKSQARAKVLEEVGQRWNWNNQGSS